MNQPTLLRLMKAGAAAFALAALFAAHRADAQSYTKLYQYPIDSRNQSGILTPGLMTQGRDGSIYATNANDGLLAGGSIFKMTPEGAYTQVYGFCGQPHCTDGAIPIGGLTLGRNGVMYGTANTGGAHGFGTVFMLSEAGKMKKLYDFTGGADSGYPMFPAFQAPNNAVYGAGGEPYNGDYGLIYRLTAQPRSPDGLSVLADFDYTNGNQPNMPVLASDGNFYGTALTGGDKVCRCGVIYKLTPAHKIVVLHRFRGQPVDGYEPAGVLVEGNDHAFYGVAYAGGTYNQGQIFKITAAGRYTKLHSFHYAGSDLEGKNPLSGLTLGSDGNFYGSIAGGAHGYGAVYRVTPAGSVTLMYSFCPVAGCADGFSPQTPLVQHTNGKFYGSTAGNSLGGSVFYSLDVGLAPFVSLLSPSGRPGDVIELLGQGFDTARSVQFNGVATRFSTASGGALEAVVPNGATSGFVRVVTRTGTLTSNRAFVVTR